MNFAGKAELRPDYAKRGGAPGIEPGTSRTLSGNHTTRPSALDLQAYLGHTAIAWLVGGQSLTCRSLNTKLLVAIITKKNTCIDYVTSRLAS